MSKPWSLSGNDRKPEHPGKSLKPGTRTAARPPLQKILRILSDFRETSLMWRPSALPSTYNKPTTNQDYELVKSAVKCLFAKLVPEPAALLPEILVVLGTPCRSHAAQGFG